MPVPVLLRVAAILHWFIAIGFGVFCIPAIRNLLSGRDIPFVMGLYGSSIRNYEVFQVQPGPGGATPPYFAMANIWIADAKAFAEAGRQHAKDFQPDVPNFTNVKTVAFTNVVYRVIPNKS